MTIFTHFPDYLDGIICIVLTIGSIFVIRKYKSNKRGILPFLVMIPPLTWLGLYYFATEIGISKKTDNFFLYIGSAIFIVCVTIGAYFKFKYDKELKNKN